MKSLGDIKCLKDLLLLKESRKSQNLVLTWEEYLVLREVQRKPMGTPYLVREPPFPSEATLPLRAQKLLDPTRNKQLPSASSHVLWGGYGKGMRTLRWTVTPLSTRADGRHGWSTLWIHQWPGGGHQLGGALGSSFQKGSSSELPVCSPYRGRGWGWTWKHTMSSPASWLKDLGSTAAAWFHPRPSDDCGQILSLSAYLAKAKRWVSMTLQPTLSIFCRLLLVDAILPPLSPADNKSFQFYLQNISRAPPFRDYCLLSFTQNIASQWDLLWPLYLNHCSILIPLTMFSFHFSPLHQQLIP